MTNLYNIDKYDKHYAALRSTLNRLWVELRPLLMDVERYLHASFAKLSSVETVVARDLPLKIYNLTKIVCNLTNVDCINTIFYPTVDNPWKHFDQ